MDENIQNDGDSGFSEDIETVSIPEEVVTYDEAPEGTSGDDFFKDGNEVDLDGDTDGEPDAEVESKEGEGEETPDVDFKAEVEAIKARNAELEQAQWNAEVLRRRNGDPAAGLAPDPLYGMPPEVVHAYQTVAEPMKAQLGQNLTNAVGFASAKHFGPLVKSLNAEGALAKMEQRIKNGEGYENPAEVLDIIQNVRKEIFSAINGFQNEATEGLTSASGNLVHDLSLKMATGTYIGVSTAQQSALETQTAQAALESEIGGMKETLSKSGLSFSEEEIAATMEEYGQLIQSGVPAKEAMERAAKPLKSAFNGMQTALKARGVSKVAQATKRAGHNAAINAGGPANGGASQPQSGREVFALLDSGKISTAEADKHLERLGLRAS